MSDKLTPITLGVLSCSGRISQGGDIAPSEELWCAAVKVHVGDSVTCCLGRGDVIEVEVMASKREIRIISQRGKSNLAS